MNHEKHESLEKVLFKDESFAIQGAIFEVYREMGRGFLEAVYQECLAIEFRRRQVPCEAQRNLSLAYKGDPLQQIYGQTLYVTTASLLNLRSKNSHRNTKRRSLTT